LIALLSGIVIGWSSCAGFLSFGMKNNGILTVILAIGFVAGVVAALMGAFELMIYLIRSIDAGALGGRHDHACASLLVL